MCQSQVLAGQITVSKYFQNLTEKRCEAKWSRMLKSSNKLNIKTDIPVTFIDAYNVKVFEDSCNNDSQKSSFSEMKKFNESIQRYCSILFSLLFVEVFIFTRLLTYFETFGEFQVKKAMLLKSK